MEKCFWSSDPSVVVLMVLRFDCQDIYKDRKQFSAAVFEVATLDLVNMGLKVVSYTLKDIRDDEGYLKALGQARTAEVYCLFPPRLKQIISGYLILFLLLSFRHLASLQSHSSLPSRASPIPPLLHLICAQSHLSSILPISNLTSPLSFLIIFSPSHLPIPLSSTLPLRILSWLFGGNNHLYSIHTPGSERRPYRRGGGQAWRRYPRGSGWGAAHAGAIRQRHRDRPVQAGLRAQAGCLRYGSTDKESWGRSRLQSAGKKVSARGRGGGAFSGYPSTLIARVDTLHALFPLRCLQYFLCVYAQNKTVSCVCDSVPDCGYGSHCNCTSDSLSCLYLTMN